MSCRGDTQAASQILIGISQIGNSLARQAVRLRKRATACDTEAAGAANDRRCARIGNRFVALPNGRTQGTKRYLETYNHWLKTPTRSFDGDPTSVRGNVVLFWHATCLSSRVAWVTRIEQELLTIYFLANKSSAAFTNIAIANSRAVSTAFAAKAN